MPSTSLLGNKGSLTSVTSTYAMLSMNATSIAPPMPMIAGGRPLANVVFCPVCGSTRQIWPAAPSVTYSAPSGPMVLPMAPCKPVTSRVAVGPPDGGAALDATNPTPSIITMIAPPKWNFVTRIAGFRASARMFCLFMIQFPFFVGAGLLFVWLHLEMYSRKFGLRLQRKFGNLLKTHLRRGFRRGRPRMTRILREKSFRRAAKTNTRAAATATQILLQCDRSLRFFHEFLKARIAA